MSVENVGNGFIQVVDEDGLRNVVRISAIQRICDVDEMREETFLTVGGKTLLVQSSLDKLKDVLMQWGPKATREPSSRFRVRRRSVGKDKDLSTALVQPPIPNRHRP